jgi:hypothetical protein
LRRHASCLDNMKQIGFATSIYSSDYNDYIMGVDWKSDVRGANLWQSHLIQASQYGVGACGTGLLFKENYITSKEIFFCPGRRSDDRFSIAGVFGWTKNSTTLARLGIDNIETSYLTAHGNNTGINYPYPYAEWFRMGRVDPGYI